jgi:hypothetical protein
VLTTYVLLFFRHYWHGNILYFYSASQWSVVYNVRIALSPDNNNNNRVYLHWKMGAVALKTAHCAARRLGSRCPCAPLILSHTLMAVETFSSAVHPHMYRWLINVCVSFPSFDDPWPEPLSPCDHKPSHRTLLPRGWRDQNLVLRVKLFFFDHVTPPPPPPPLPKVVCCTHPLCFSKNKSY